MKRPTISTEQCPCSYMDCPKFFLVGVGSFYQGCGFTKDQAERLAFLINNDPDFPFEEHD